MSEQLFSEAMGELSDKYITEALNYQCKTKKNNLFFWKKQNMGMGVSKRIAIVLLIILFAVPCTVYAFREAVTEYIVEITERYYDFFFGTGMSDGVEVPYSFVIYPEGFEEISYEVNDAAVIQELRNANGDEIILSQAGDGWQLISNEDVEVEITDVDGMKVMIYQKKGTNLALWVNDSYRFTLVYYGECDVSFMKELIKMIGVRED